MKVLMIARDTLYTSPGGDTVQIEMTAKHLNLLGIDTKIALADETIDYSKYELIHFFNLVRPDDILPHLDNTLPCVLSTIFVDYSEYDKRVRRGVTGLLFRFLSGAQIEYLKVIARYLMKGDRIKSKYFLRNGQKKSVNRILKRTKLLLPNSHSEYKRLCNSTALRLPYYKIVNAVDHHVFSDTVRPNLAFRDHVICVGRIEGLKNQKNLIRALTGTSIPLTIIGKPALNQRGYYEECKKLAADEDNIHFIEHIDHKELVSIYKAARVHALPSWFETTGLSSLEAAAMGCNIVITNKGDTEEYFQNFAYYCNPDDVDSIRSAVLNAYQAPRNTILQEYVRQNFTWEQAALQTLKAYQRALT